MYYLKFGLMITYIYTLFFIETIEILIYFTIPNPLRMFQYYITNEKKNSHVNFITILLYECPIR